MPATGRDRRRRPERGRGHPAGRVLRRGCQRGPHALFVDALLGVLSSRSSRRRRRDAFAWSRSTAFDVRSRPWPSARRMARRPCSSRQRTRRHRPHRLPERQGRDLRAGPVPRLVHQRAGTSPGCSDRYRDDRAGRPTRGLGPPRDPAMAGLEVLPGWTEEELEDLRAPLVCLAYQVADRSRWSSRPPRRSRELGGGELAVRARRTEHWSGRRSIAGAPRATSRSLAALGSGRAAARQLTLAERSSPDRTPDRDATPNRHLLGPAAGTTRRGRLPSLLPCPGPSWAVRRRS